MKDKTTKKDRWLDFLFPWDMSSLFESRKIEKSIKIILISLIFVGLFLLSMETVQGALVSDMTMGEMCLMLGFSFVVYVALYLVIIHLIGGVLVESIMLAIKKNRNDMVEERPVPMPKVLRYNGVINLPDPKRLEEYIRSHKNKFSKGEDIAILYTILQKREVTYANMKDFHEWLEGCAPGVGYNAFSEARKRLKEKMEDEDERTINKYEEMDEELKDFIFDDK